MNRQSFLIILLMTCFFVPQVGCKTSSTVNSNLQSSDYDPIKPGSIWLYQFTESKNTLTTQIDTVQKEIDGKNYYKVNRSYSWGESSESFNRVENDVVYVFDYKTNAVSVVIPKQIQKGIKWQEGDGSWNYKIINTNTSITTPVSTYTELLQVRASQLTGRDKEKASQYDLFYKNGIGLVATEVKGKLLTYLKKYELK
jgi:hypothetical protein